MMQKLAHLVAHLTTSVGHRLKVE